MLQLWTTGTHTPKLLLFSTAIGKLQRDACKGQQPSRTSVSPLNHIIIAAVKSEASTVRGKIGEREVDIMLDSGSSVSLLKEEVMYTANFFTICIRTNFPTEYGPGI